MDPGVIAIVEQSVSEYLSTCGIAIPSWVKVVLTLMGIQLTAITAKLGHDIYQYRIKKPDPKAPVRIVDTPQGQMPERRKWDAHRCDEHLKRIAGVEAALHKVEPELTRFEERFAAHLARMEKGDSRFNELTESINTLNTNTAVLSKQMERLEKVLDRNGKLL